MINLEVIANKLDRVLNGTDLEIPSGAVSPTNDKYFFGVYSQGLFLSQINDMGSGKNFIPVIVGGYGGENNPVEGLGEQDRNVTIQILFPVRFKQDMYALEEYLDDYFVGRFLTFGSQKAVCNLSPAQYGELQDFSFNEFKLWVENVYKMPLDIAETYMSMEITLYLSTMKGAGEENGFVYGNAFTYTIEIGTIVDNEFSAFFTDDDPVFISNTDNASMSPATQQLLGDKYTRGLGSVTAFGKNIVFYVKANEDYATLIQKFQERDLQGLIVKIDETYTLCDTYEETEERSYYITDMILQASKGEAMTISITLGDKLDI